MDDTDQEQEPKRRSINASDLKQGLIIRRDRRSSITGTYFRVDLGADWVVEHRLVPEGGEPVIAGHEVFNLREKRGGGVPIGGEPSWVARKVLVLPPVRLTRQELTRWARAHGQPMKEVLKSAGWGSRPTRKAPEFQRGREPNLPEYARTAKRLAELYKKALQEKRRPTPVADLADELNRNRPANRQVSAKTVENWSRLCRKEFGLLTNEYALTPKARGHLRDELRRQKSTKKKSTTKTKPTRKKGEE